MNKVILMGRLARDPDVRYAANAEQTCIARYSLAVDRRFKREGDATADFISCVALGRNGEFANKYLRKGIKVVVEGRLQTGTYKNRDGKTIYTTDVIVESQEFSESKAASGNNQSNNQSTSDTPVDSDGFYNIPDDANDDELPFN